MEKKKLLLVAISAGLFLVITIGAAIMFTPQTTPIPPAPMAHISNPNINNPNINNTNRSENSTGISLSPPSLSTLENQMNEGENGNGNGSVYIDPVELVRGNGNFPGLQSNGSNPEPNFVISGSTQAQETDRMINVPRPSTAAVPDAAPSARANQPERASPPAAPAANPAPAARPANPAPAATPAATPAPAAAPAATPAPTAPVPTPAVTANPAPASTPPAASPVSMPPANQNRVQDDFWVQTGSFSTIARAELVKDTLMEKGISSLIENREIEGRTYYRVRVGPYTSHNEAAYWLNLIQSIDGFEESQIWQTPARR